MKTYAIDLKDEAATERLGQALANTHALKGLVITLAGELGAGKTTLARGLLRALGHQGTVKSPTYTLLESYDLPEHTVWHLDLYRIHDPQELEYLGIRDAVGTDITWLIEWPQRGEDVLPAADLHCTIRYHQGGRRAVWEAHSEQGERALAQLMSS